MVEDWNCAKLPNISGWFGLPELSNPRLEGRAMDLGLNAIFIESHTLQAEVRRQQQHGQVVDHGQHQKCCQDHLNLCLDRLTWNGHVCPGPAPLHALTSTYPPTKVKHAKENNL